MHFILPVNMTEKVLCHCYLIVASTGLGVSSQGYIVLTILFYLISRLRLHVSMVTSILSPCFSHGIHQSWIIQYVFIVPDNGP